MFIPTLREVPAEAEAVSHILMLRAGYIRQLAAGLYIYLPLAWRVLRRINNIIRQEMHIIGAQELSMPALHPSEIWQKTKRWDDIGEEMFRLSDRGGRDLCLGMTHEEVVTWLASKEIRSYRELPQVWFQIQTKFRDEARPKSGVLRTREFIMKDSYSFDRDENGLAASYKNHSDAYHRIFTRCGLKYHQVESDPGMMGGAAAHEFMAPSAAGEDSIVLCSPCGYAANIELAQSVPEAQPLSSHEENWTFEDIPTPEKRTVDEVSGFLGISPVYFIKSLLFIGKDGPFLALIRGDQELHEKKLQRIVGDYRAAHKEEIKDILGTEAGFIGPHNHELVKYADISLRQGIYISGANKKDFHTKGIKPSVHFKAEWFDLHAAREGEQCPKCRASMTSERVIEIGNIFKLGIKYSQSLNAVYLDEKGNEIPIIMGSYGIGPARIAAAAIEQNHDDDGIIWPMSIAPFDVEIIPLTLDDEVMRTAKQLYDTLKEEGIETLMDDRDERPGVKFKDADLIGLPLQIIIGGRSLKQGLVEIKSRKTKETRKSAREEVIENLKAIMGTLKIQ
jgi:prolyl-tRNA synthetase